MEVQNSHFLAVILKAERALLRGDYKNAVTLYTRLINDPLWIKLDKEKLSAFYLNRGCAYRKINRQHDALQDYEKASKLNPNSFKPHLRAALIYAQDFQRYSQALSEFDKAIALSPTNIDALSSRAITKILIRDHNGAEEDLRTALSIAPNHPDVLCNFGNLYLSRGDPRKAAEMYKKALEINSRDTEIRVNLAMALERMGLRDAVDGVLQEGRKAIEMWEAKGYPPIKPRMSFLFALFLTIVFLLMLILVISKLR
jgi:tetratricopeptide (TPR) repeat protein